MIDSSETITNLHTKTQNRIDSFGRERERERETAVSKNNKNADFSPGSLRRKRGKEGGVKWQKREKEKSVQVKNQTNLAPLPTLRGERHEHCRFDLEN